MTATIISGQASLGIELGSTRIKACLVGQDPSEVLAVGSHQWDNDLVDGHWTYGLDDIIGGVQAAFADLARNVQRTHGVALTNVRALGISAMMHGYLACDAQGELLVPFRTWRNTSTADAAVELSHLFGVNIPQRWSIAHYRQAIRDGEPHVPQVRSLTTLAGYVHRLLTGRHVLGIGDASGMFPIDPKTGTYDADCVARWDALERGESLTALLPEVLPAGADAGAVTAAGAALLDPTGVLQPGALTCPPEGDAGTGMVATHAVAPRTGNVSAGTSVFAMVVLDAPLRRAYPEIDIVTTPTGRPVAMVHCNNGASELGAWARVFQQFAEAAGASSDADAVFEVLLTAALSGEADAGGLVAYNQIAGEPVAGVEQGRPLVMRTPDSTLSLANLMRAQVYGVFASLALGMRILDAESVVLDQMNAHGGVFRTAGIAQRLLAAALGAPVAVERNASEGGAWGIAVLASYAAERTNHAHCDLDAYLTDVVFAEARAHVVSPDPDDVAGFAAYLTRYQAGLAAERAAAAVR